MNAVSNSKISEAEVLHLGVLVDAVLGALPADPGLLHATERGLRAALRGGRENRNQVTVFGAFFTFTF